MSLANEAAYLYVLSKELTKINRVMKKLGAKAQKHLEKHRKATTPEKKEKHRQNMHRK